MRITALFAALLAVGASTVASAPASTIVASHTPSAVLPNAYSNTTLSPTALAKADAEEEKFLREHLPKYDPKAAAKFAEYFQTVMYGNNQTSRNNAMSRTQASIRAAAPIKGTPTAFCVGIAYNPVRTKIFKNMETCDIQGWNTLWVFTANTEYDPYMSRDPMCVGQLHNPTRSMFFSGVTKCSDSGWVTDFSFYETGRDGHPAGTETMHESTDMWQADDPHRMLIYPHYKGAEHGWRWAYEFRYVNRWRLPTAKELDILRPHIYEHGELRKRNWFTEIIRNTAERNAINALIAQWDLDRIDFYDMRRINPSNMARFRAAAVLGGFTNQVENTYMEVNSHMFSSVTNIVLRVNGRILASITIPRNVHFGANIIREALRLSYRTAQPEALEARNLLQGIFASMDPQGNVRIMADQNGWDVYGKNI
ncbi:hypothetical protein BGZ95_004726 [Linnemannia exigua]|uniref:Uncharacterized protein n=1 Tax=Linnemannia exigua TaxID=604196 RepID=A0AAD4DHM2_9FUNG|nr:hypothetical protein BGZ95_004726 [Linnemannia exigua]